MIQITLCRKTNKEIGRIIYPDSKDVPWLESTVAILRKSEKFKESYENQLKGGDNFAPIGDNLIPFR